MQMSGELLQVSAYQHLNLTVLHLFFPGIPLEIWGKKCHFFKNDISHTLWVKILLPQPLEQREHRFQ